MSRGKQGPKSIPNKREKGETFVVAPTLRKREKGTRRDMGKALSPSGRKTFGAQDIAREKVGGRGGSVESKRNGPQSEGEVHRADLG